MSSCQSSWKRQYNCNSHGAFIICVCVCLSIIPLNHQNQAASWFLLTDIFCWQTAYSIPIAWLDIVGVLTVCDWRLGGRLMHVAGDAWSLLHFFGLDLDLMLLLAVAAFQVFPPHKRKINWPKPKFKLSLFSHVSQSETRFESIASHASNALQSASTRNIAVQQDNGVPAGQNKKCASKRSMDARKSISLRIMVELKMFEGSKASRQKTNQSFSKDLLPTFTSLEGSRNGALLLVVLLLCQLQRC